jgi:uncharacterized protein YjbJ (UPF0337 family)
VGKAKEAVGKATGDRRTEWSGKVEQVKGKVHEVIGEAKAEAAQERAERERAGKK